MGNIRTPTTKTQVGLRSLFFLFQVTWCIPGRRKQEAFPTWDRV